MARATKARALKVYRTAIGFHDAYVAAPSKKAALAAWGTDKDLFARGAAELVEDPALTAAPLASPGEVVRVLRGSAADHVKALGKVPRPRPSAKKAPAAEPEAQAPAPAPPPPPPPPRPSRTALDCAEKTDKQLRARHEAERERLAERKAALAEEERQLRDRQRQQVAKASDALDRAEAAYRDAMEAWRDA